MMLHRITCGHKKLKWFRQTSGSVNISQINIKKTSQGTLHGGRRALAYTFSLISLSYGRCLLSQKKNWWENHSCELTPSSIATHSRSLSKKGRDRKIAPLVANVFHKNIFCRCIVIVVYVCVLSISLSLGMRYDAGSWSKLEHRCAFKLFHFVVSSSFHLREDDNLLRFLYDKGWEFA